MAITAEQVKTLREMTGAGMMECKKALTETNGDLQKAVEELRKSGIGRPRSAPSAPLRRDAWIATSTTRASACCSR